MPENNLGSPGNSRNTSLESSGNIRNTTSRIPSNSRNTSSESSGNIRNTSLGTPSNSRNTSSRNSINIRNTFSETSGNSRNTSSGTPGNSRNTSSGSPGNSRNTSSGNPSNSRNTSSGIPSNSRNTSSGTNRRILQRGGVQRGTEMPTLRRDYAHYTAGPSIAEFTRRVHTELEELPNLADRVVPEEAQNKIQFSPDQVDEFVQSLPRVKTSSLETEEQICSICKFDYGKVRGSLAEPVSNTKQKLVSDVDQGLPGEEMPEYAAKLPCGHVYGEWCIKTWLLSQPATCPTCRFRFQPV